mmetsp:Transcript_10626/g.33618  ORF Transcript_10626/g.33618 Transcript_10626/m.33618 type:complete len:219 (-) Transcript_10626:349-1005(-)
MYVGYCNPLTELPPSTRAAPITPAHPLPSRQASGGCGGGVDAGEHRLESRLVVGGVLRAEGGAGDVVACRLDRRRRHLGRHRDGGDLDVCHVDLVFHHLLEDGDRHRLRLSEAQLLVVLLLQRRLRALRARADRLCVEARVRAGGVGVVEDRAFAVPARHQQRHAKGSSHLRPLRLPEPESKVADGLREGLAGHGLVVGEAVVLGLGASVVDERASVR